MKEKWIVIINGENFVEETTRANWAIRCALQKYKWKHGNAYAMMKELTILIRRENLKDFPVSKVV